MPEQNSRQVTNNNNLYLMTGYAARLKLFWPHVLYQIAMIFPLPFDHRLGNTIVLSKKQLGKLLSIRLKA